MDRDKNGLNERLEVVEILRKAKQLLPLPQTLFSENDLMNTNYLMDKYEGVVFGFERELYFGELELAWQHLACFARLEGCDILVWYYLLSAVMHFDDAEYLMNRLELINPVYWYEA